jgi:hypothetical protein
MRDREPASGGDVDMAPESHLMNGLSPATSFCVMPVGFGALSKSVADDVS